MITMRSAVLVVALMSLEHLACKKKDVVDQRSSTMVVSVDNQTVVELAFRGNTLERIDYKTEDSTRRAPVQSKLDALLATAEREGLPVEWSEHKDDTYSRYGGVAKPGEAHFALALHDHLERAGLQVRAK